MKAFRYPKQILQATFLYSCCLVGVGLAQRTHPLEPEVPPAVSLDNTKHSTPNFPPIVPNGRPSIGLALEGGGALGLAHIGVLEWIEENHIPVDRISGTSMGALVGAFFASGMSVKDLNALATGDALSTLFSIRPAYSRLGFRRRQDRSELPQGLSIGLRGGRISLGNALVADDRLDTLLSDELVATTQLVLISIAFLSDFGVLPPI